jgi:N-acetylneuraminic acid mutarotase
MRTSVCLLVLLCVFLFLPSVLADENCWVTTEQMPSRRSDFGVAVVDGKIYVIGGRCLGDHVGLNEMYDPETDTWTTKASMPTGRSSFAIAVYDGKIYAFGGTTGSSSAMGGYILTDANEVYDPTTDTWENRSGLPTARMCFNAHAVGDKIFTLSGAEFQDTFMVYGLGVTEVYDPETDSWNTKTQIPVAVYGYASAAVGDEIFVIGGVMRGSMGEFMAKLNQVYDTKTDRWSNKTAPLTELYKASAGVTTGVFAPVQIIVVGGQDGSLECFNITQVYNPADDTWRYGASMPTNRSRLGVAVVYATLYALGGWTDGVYQLANEQYTPEGYIPEFPTLFFLPFVLATVFVVVIYRKHMATNLPR